jgi:2-polyprenyl-6-methoxyphenol hydroxylase-like FAD-dependent oxidoreductase
MADNQRILIVGAGVAGLALGRALRQQGVAVEIVERRDAWEIVGAGIFLPANGSRALRALGLLDAVGARARTIRRQRFLDHHGRLLVDLDMHALWGDVGPCLALSRSALHDALLDGAREAPLRMGTTVAAFDQDDGGVSVTFSDGSHGRYDLVVGADGIHSATRRLVFGGRPPSYVGQVSWRCIVPAPVAIDHWTALLARGRTFLMLPLPGEQVYCYGDRSAARAEVPEGDGAGRFRALFRDFAAPVPQLLDGISGATPLFGSPIEEVDQVPWVRGRVVLIGDAAHATSPNMAEGACLALEDALVLSRALAEGHVVEESLLAFEDRRRARVRWVQRQTHRRDRIRGLAPAIRDAVLRARGSHILQANYAPLLADV